MANIGSGNALVPSGNKPLPGPMLTHHQWGSVAFNQEQFHSKCPRYQSLKRFENYDYRITATSPRRQWVNVLIRVLWNVHQTRFHYSRHKQNESWRRQVASCSGSSLVDLMPSHWTKASLLYKLYIQGQNWVTLKRKQKNLTRWGLVTPYGVGDLGQHWFRY